MKRLIGGPFLIFLAAVALILGATAAFSATVEVYPGQSIQTAINNSTAGDTINVNPGDYTGGITVSKAITVTGKPGAKLHASTPGSGQGVTITSDNCTVQGLYLDSFQVGIGPASIGSMSGFKTGVTIKNNHVYNSQYHCWIGGTQWLVQGNEFEKVRWWDNTGGDADYCRMFGTGHIFRGNYLHGTRFDNTDLAPASGSDYAHTDGIQYYGSNGEVLKTSTIDYNFFTDFHQGLFLCDEASGSLNTLTIQHNVFWGQTYTPAPGSSNFTGRPSWGICIGKNVGGTSMTVKNNIIYNVNNAFGIRASSSGVWTKNVIYGLSAGTAYDPSTTSPSLVTIDNYRYGMASVGQTGYVGSDITSNPTLANIANPLGADGVPMTSDDGWRTTANGALLYGPQLTNAPAPPPPAPTPTPVPDPTTMEWQRVRVYNTNGTLKGYRWAQVTTTDVRP